MNDEQSFINNIRQTLDLGAEQLDVNISRRLRLARRPEEGGGRGTSRRRRRG